MFFFENFENFDLLKQKINVVKLYNFMYYGLYDFW